MMSESSVALGVVCLFAIIILLQGCSTLPLDGSALGALRKDDKEACNCEVQVTCN